MDREVRAQLQVVILTGHEDPERVLLGLNIALVAASSDVDVTIFFTLRGTSWACSAQPMTSAIEKIVLLLEQLLEAGVQLECCSACLANHCVEAAVDPRSGLKDGVELAGLATLVERVTKGVNTLSF